MPRETDANTKGYQRNADYNINFNANFNPDFNARNHVNAASGQCPG
jgi:hypothetical protein